MANIQNRRQHSAAPEPSAFRRGLLHLDEVCCTMRAVARELFKGPSTLILWDLEDSRMLRAAAPCCIL